MTRRKKPSASRGNAPSSRKRTISKIRPTRNYCTSTNKLKDKYSTEVREVEQESDKSKEEFEKLKQKYKDLNEKFVTLEIDNEELERRNQAYESAVEY
mmetsp:Transcript_22169/g.25470  ORF Transcript_22169/g.25470 Transcript_22169/m.25470 type:complete len:98 (+) Transcript_22169:110-403(+)